MNHLAVLTPTETRFLWTLLVVLFSMEEGDVYMARRAGREGTHWPADESFDCRLSLRATDDWDEKDLIALAIELYFQSGGGFRVSRLRNWKPS